MRKVTDKYIRRCTRIRCKNGTSTPKSYHCTVKYMVGKSFNPLSHSISNVDRFSPQCFSPEANITLCRCMPKIRPGKASPANPQLYYLPPSIKLYLSQPYLPLSTVPAALHECQEEDSNHRDGRVARVSSHTASHLPVLSLQLQALLLTGAGCL